MGVATTTCKEKNGTQVGCLFQLESYIEKYTLLLPGVFFRFLQFCPVGGLLIHPQEE
jgi:hypothetical protein